MKDLRNSKALSFVAILVVIAMLSINAFAAATLPVVQQGNTGTLVTTMQYLLRAHGYSLSVDGSFGPGTLSAVKSFQKAKGLSQDGIAGPNTWSKLFITVKQGSSGDAVRAAQYVLKNRHGYSISVDGSFGPATLSAVKSFQKAKGLSQDGSVGPDTWSYLVGTGTATPPSTGNVTINFTSSVNTSVISTKTLSVVKQLVSSAGMNSATITSSLRSPEDQAAAMYTNCANNGAASQKALYGANGDAVIDVYIAGVNKGLSKSTIISNMAAKIRALWPGLVSNHCVSPEQYSKRNVIDIGYSSISNKDAFRRAINNAKSNGTVAVFTDEPGNGCFHIEILQ